MGQVDITEKMLADYNDVFADIVNVLLFDGRQVVLPDDLENVKDKSQYKADDSKIHEEERDIVKVFKKENIRISLIGLENQTNIDKDEPLRVIGYDGASYKSQLVSGTKERYPVVTLVLYFGMQRWRDKHSLYDVLTIGEEWKPYVSDYRINVFEIAYLTQEQVEKFQSDFKIVADYFVQKRTTKNYKPSRETIQHVDEMLKLMAVLTGDRRFEEVQTVERKGGEESMGEAWLDKLLAESEHKGEQRGEKRGMIKVLREMGYSLQDIAAKVKLPVSEVEELIVSLDR